MDEDGRHPFDGREQSKDHTEEYCLDLSSRPCNPVFHGINSTIPVQTFCSWKVQIACDLEYLGCLRKQYIPVLSPARGCFLCWGQRHTLLQNFRPTSVFFVPTLRQHQCTLCLFPLIAKNTRRTKLKQKIRYFRSISFRWGTAKPGVINSASPSSLFHLQVIVTELTIESSFWSKRTIRSIFRLAQRFHPRKISQIIGRGSIDKEGKQNSFCKKLLS